MDLISMYAKRQAIPGTPRESPTVSTAPGASASVDPQCALLHHSIYLYYTAVRRCRAGTPLRRVGELWGLEGALTGACSTRDGCSGPNKHVGRVLVDSCHLERIAQHVGGPRGPPAGPPRRSAQRMLHLDCCARRALWSPNLQPLDFVSVTSKWQKRDQRNK